MLKDQFTFSHKAPPLFIALMQITAAIFTEIINIAVISQSNTTIEVIMDYIALGIIAEIDTLFADRIQMHIFKSIKESENWHPYKQYRDKELKSRRDCCNKTYFIIFKVFKLIYACFYFYFFPFLVIYMNYGFNYSTSCKEMEIC